MNNRLNALSNKRFFIWYVLVLVAVFVFLYILTKDIRFPLFVTGLGFMGSVLSLLLSKFWAKHTHDITIITKESGGDAGKLYMIVENLAQKANLPKTPEVGIYESPDCNAFATGFNKSNSLIAFSNGLLNTLSLDEVEAVAAHEIAHITNQDMLGTVLIEGTVKSIFYFVKIPFWILGWFYSFTSKNGESDWEVQLSFWAGTIISAIIMFLGHLVSLFFSRHREYKADATAALLTSSEAMRSALAKLAQDENEIPVEQAEFSCFKIKNKITFAEIFSTHPPIEKRIEALKNYK